MKIDVFCPRFNQTVTVDVSSLTEVLRLKSLAEKNRDSTDEMAMWHRWQALVDAYSEAVQHAI